MLKYLIRKIPEKVQETVLSVVFLSELFIWLSVTVSIELTDSLVKSFNAF